MDKILVTGGNKLSGTVTASGAKNSALPILISSVLGNKVCNYTRVPALKDIDTTLKLLTQIGCKTSFDIDSNSVSIDPTSIHSQEAPYDLVRTMRASIVILGPLLAKYGYAKVSLPGGCAIGARPVNYHLTGLEKLGAQIELENGYVIAKAKRLKGARVVFEFPSVGATENIMMAAVLAEGESILENCAREPEIADLAIVLKKMGAKIQGEGTETITIQGVSSLGGCTHDIIADRIEAGTFLAAALATKGSVTIEGAAPSLLESALIRLEEMGAKILRGDSSVGVEYTGPLKATNLTTQPFPGFPTDLQAQFMSLMLFAEGTSIITEAIFENRFMHVPELSRLGSNIVIRGNTAIVAGPQKLVGAPVMATDLRASASLIIAGLVAEGQTLISRVYHLDRGYEKIEKKLTSLGAIIQRLP
jgi:UDP-N-acetylglucosamine 1-carboxyvinyltransferase